MIITKSEWHLVLGGYNNDCKQNKLDKNVRHSQLYVWGLIAVGQTQTFAKSNKIMLMFNGKSKFG